MPGLVSATPAVDISSANFEVLASGTVITNGPDELTISLGGSKIRFSFMKDGGGQRLTWKPTAQGEMIIDVWNFHNSLGTGTTSPIELGEWNGRRLFLQFVVYAFSDASSKTVHYTFYLGS